MVVVGSATIDFVWRTNATLQPGRTVVLMGETDPTPRFGGGAPTAAIELARLHHDVRLMSWLGDDRLGKEYLEYLRGAGVDTEAVIVARDRSTPRIWLVRDPAGSTLCVYHPSDSDEIRLTQGMVNSIRTAGATILTVGPVVLTEQVRQNRPANGVFVWNVKADPTAYPIALRRDLLREADVVTLNEDEVPFLAEAIDGPIDKSDSHTLVRLLCRSTGAAILVTAGSKGAWTIHQDRVVSAEPNRTIATLAIGAGDAFTAAVASTLVSTPDILVAMRRAVDHATDFLLRQPQIEE